MRTLAKHLETALVRADAPLGEGVAALFVLLERAACYAATKDAKTKADLLEAVASLHETITAVVVETPRRRADGGRNGGRP